MDARKKWMEYLHFSSAVQMWFEALSYTSLQKKRVHSLKKCHCKSVNNELQKIQTCRSIRGEKKEMNRHQGTSSVLRCVSLLWRKRCVHWKMWQVIRLINATLITFKMAKELINCYIYRVFLLSAVCRALLYNYGQWLAKPLVLFAARMKRVIGTGLAWLTPYRTSEEETE